MNFLRSVLTVFYCFAWIIVIYGAFLMAISGSVGNSVDALVYASSVGYISLIKLCVMLNDILKN